MNYFVICLVAFIASGLTLFSGFGLGTILLPAFALFFPIDIAVSLTAIGHFLNNILKLFLLGKQAKGEVVLAFGLPAIAAAFVGALVLLCLGHMKPILNYQFGGHEFSIFPVKIIIAFLMIAFALIEILPQFSRLKFDKKYLPFGGILSGFFGGLSGHQGALRSAFLIKCGLTKESFIATGIVIACLVDISRIAVYGTHIFSGILNDQKSLLLAAVLSAFIGAYIGNRLVNKITLRIVQNIVTAMLLLIALFLGAGII